MSLRSWLPQGSLKPLAGMAASSVAAGLAFGMYLQLPGYLSEPVYKGEPGYIDQEDPGRAKWREVVSSLGGLGATFMIPAAYLEPTPAPVFAAEVDRRFDDLIAEVQSEVEGVRRQVSWSEDEAWNRRQAAELQERDWRRQRAQAMSFGFDRPPERYEAPVYIGRYETPTVEYRDGEPVPPPPPEPSIW